MSQNETRRETSSIQEHTLPSNQSAEVAQDRFTNPNVTGTKQLVFKCMSSKLILVDFFGRNQIDGHNHANKMFIFDSLK